MSTKGDKKGKKGPGHYSMDFELTCEAPTKVPMLTNMQVTGGKKPPNAELGMTEKQAAQYAAAASTKPTAPPPTLTCLADMFALPPSNLVKEGGEEPDLLGGEPLTSQQLWNALDAGLNSSGGAVQQSWSAVDAAGVQSQQPACIVVNKAAKIAYEKLLNSKIDKILFEDGREKP
jgi:hypothetical protein